MRSDQTRPCSFVILRPAIDAISFEINQFRYVRRKLREERDNFAKKPIQRVVKERRSTERITDSGTLPLRANQLRCAQNGELPGDCRLHKPKDLLQFPNAEASRPQKINNAQTSAIR